MRLDAGLDEILQTRAHVRSLRALFGLPLGFAASARDVARRAGISHPTASRALGALASQGIVSVLRQGRADTYQLNRDHVLYPVLAGLFAREARVRQQLLDFLRAEIPRRLGPVRGAYLFGSALTRDMTSDSDIDVALITPSPLKGLRERRRQDLERAVRRRFGSKLSFVVASEPISRLTSPGHPGHRLWTKALQGISLLGRS